MCISTLTGIFYRINFSIFSINCLQHYFQGVLRVGLEVLQGAGRVDDIGKHGWAEIQTESIDILLDGEEAEVNAPVDEVVFHHARDRGFFDAGLLKNRQAETLNHASVILFFHDADHIFDDDLN